MPQVTPFDNILAQCRDLFCERLVTALAGMLDKADDVLSALESETRDTQAQALYRGIRDKLLPQREKFEAQFRARYLREFQQRSSRAKRIDDDFADADLPDIELALVGEDDLNETLKFNAMTARLRQYCEEELIALDQRVGVLFGDAGLQSDDNPFTPQAISDAYKQTCAQLDSNVEARLVLLKLFDEFVLDEIRGIYRGVNALLVQNSILPKLRGLGAPRKERTKPPVPEVKIPEQDLFALLQNLMGKNPVGAVQAMSATSGTPAQAVPAMPGIPPIAGVPGAPAVVAGGGAQVLQSGELLRSLTRVQLGDLGAVTGNTVPLAAIMAEPGTTNVLRELKATSLVSSMSQMDAMTLDIVAMLFDQLFDDPKIPIGVKGLIGRLQIPFLKVVIADKAFFSRKSHPARQMLDTLGEVAARLPADVNASNPTFVRLDGILQGLMEGFEDNIEIFDAVREKLDALVTEEDQRIEEQAQAEEKQIEQQESLALAKTVAQTEIKMRLRASKPPRFVLEFLQQQWIKVLLLVQVKEGEDSTTWKSALETMDLLIWSVEPKDTREGRRELVGKVPELLKRLADALTAAGIDDSVRTSFIADLRKLHSEIIAGNGGQKAPAAVPESPPAAAPEAPAPGPEQPAIEAAAVITDAPAEVPPVPESLAIEIPPAIALMPEEEAPVVEPPVIDTGSTLTDMPGESAPPQEIPVIEVVPAISPPSEEPAPAFELPTIEPAPEIAVSIALQTPESELPAIEFPPPLPVAPEEPALALELPAIEPAPANAAPPSGSQSGLELPALDFALEILAHPPEPKPAIEKRPPAAAAPRDPTPRLEPQPAAKQPAQRDKQSAPAAAKPAEPASLDMTAPVTVNNPFGAGKVEVNDLDFTVQAPGNKAGAKPAPALPAGLTLGAWVDIAGKQGAEARRQVAKLAFISPLKTRYLFADRHGKTVLECSQAELVRLFQVGMVSITKEPNELPLFDRLTEGLVGKLGQRR